MVDHEQRVREAAYFLWQAEGCPEGRAEMHWSVAEIATVLFSYLSQGVRQLPPQKLSDGSNVARLGHGLSEGRREHEFFPEDEPHRRC